MRAGLLNSRVTIQQLAAGQDALGQPVQTWSDVATVWANIRHSSGVENIKSDAEMSVVRASIRIRYKTGITTGMRAVSGGVSYDIMSVLPDMGGKEYTDLVCEVVS